MRCQWPRAPTPRDEQALRQSVLAFLALNEWPGRWTFFRAAAESPPGASRGLPRPDIVVEVGGRVAYVEVRRQGGGPLPPARAAALAAARARGASCFVVRSLPEMERALCALGIGLRPRGRMIGRLAAAAGERKGQGHAGPA